MMQAGAAVHEPTRPRRLARRQLVGVLAAAGVVGVGIGLALHLLLASSTAVVPQTLPAPALSAQAVWPSGARPAPMIPDLRDQDGRVFSLGALRGRTVAIAFFDSYCTQACPLEGRALAAAERSLPAARRPVLVVVSVNPRDTPASTRSAAERWGLAASGSWFWLRGTHTQLARAWGAYHIFVAPPRGGDIAHTEAVYLLDRHGDERAGYLYPFMPRFVGHDLGVLAAAAGGRR